MKLIPILLALFSVLTGVITSLNAQPTKTESFEFPKWLVLGSKIPKTIEREKNGESELVTLIDGNYFYAMYPIHSHGMEAKVLSYDSDKKRKIRGVLITDENCETPEGIKLGATYQDIKDLAPGTPEPHYGWVHFWTLPSGWIAIFAEGATEIEPITNKSKVISLFSYGDDPDFNNLVLKKSNQPNKTVLTTSEAAPPTS